MFYSDQGNTNKQNQYLAYTTLPIFYTLVQGRSSTKRKFPTCENSKVSSMKRNVHQREQFLPVPMPTSLIVFGSPKKHKVFFQLQEVKYDSTTPCRLRSVPESKHGKNERIHYFIHILDRVTYAWLFHRFVHDLE